jgi:hypothetical protein
VLKSPADIFTKLEEILTARPHLLVMDDYHTYRDGEEAFTEEQILDPSTAHCLAGWVVVLTPNAAKYERHEDIDIPEYANRMLMHGGHPKIPKSIYFSDNESVMKLVRGRAAEHKARITDG